MLSLYRTLANNQVSNACVFRRPAGMLAYGYLYSIPGGAALPADM